MGASEDYQDARARGNYPKAFSLAVEIMNRKGSKRLIDAWIDEALWCLEQMEELDLLPENFRALSVYGKREELNRIKVE
jgi:hypothetical protein